MSRKNVERNGCANTAGDTATLVTANGAFDLYDASPGTSQSGSFALNLNGGTLDLDYFEKSSVGNQSASINFNGGVLEPLENDASTLSGFLPALTGLTANVGAGGAIVNTDGFNISIGQALVHSARGSAGTVSCGWATSLAYCRMLLA